MLSRKTSVWLLAVTLTCGCGSKTAGNIDPPPDVPPSCGDDVREQDEECDGSDLRSESCASLGYDGGALACTSVCTWDFSACTGEPPSCGDGLAEGNEQCDGDDLQNMTCRAIGYDGGEIGCGDDCSLDASGCTGDPPVCGDANAEGLEECDGIDVRNLDCGEFGYSGGTLACTDDCLLDTSGCAGESNIVCGDGSADGIEQCDGDDISEDCQALGYDGGVIACDPDCTFNVFGCTGDGAVCGNEIKEGLEECDGTDLGGEECTDLEYRGGDLACDSSCSFDPSGCTRPECQNDVREPGEACDGEDLGDESCESLGFAGGDLICTSECTFDTSSCIDPVCGDGDINQASEQCDGQELDGKDCTDFDLANGELACSDCTFDTSNCVAASCGDGTVNQDSEQCDGDDLDGESCASLGFAMGQLVCTTECSFNTIRCFGSTAECGDGTAEGPEACDTDDLRGETCESQGYDGGNLACTTCELDYSDCTGDGPTCGDDTAEGTEECDGEDLRNMDCEDFGFTGGTLNCNNCSFVFRDCELFQGAECGDNEAEGFEACDGTDLRSQSCETLDAGEGDLACRDDCSWFDLSDCSDAPTCGDNDATGDEICDGDDLRDLTCEHFLYGGGELACLPTCRAFDLSNCTGAPPTCGTPPGIQGEQCDGNALHGATCESLGYDSGELACHGNCSFNVSDCVSP